MQIDVRLLNETVEILTKGTAEARQQVIERIKAYPENFAPPVFYVLSAVLFNDGKKDEALFWFYAGQLRARFDANRCADVSAEGAVELLNDQFGPPINRYAFRDIPTLEKLVPRVVDWDQKTPHSYDQRWINLHGMGAMMSGLSLSEAEQQEFSLPKEQWDEIAEKTRADYLSDFMEVLKNSKD